VETILNSIKMMIILKIKASWTYSVRTMRIRINHKTIKLVIKINTHVRETIIMEEANLEMTKMDLDKDQSLMMIKINFKHLETWINNILNIRTSHMVNKISVDTMKTIEWGNHSITVLTTSIDNSMFLKMHMTSQSVFNHLTTSCKRECSTATASTSKLKMMSSLMTNQLKNKVKSRRAWASLCVVLVNHVKERSLGI